MIKDFEMRSKTLKKPKKFNYSTYKNMKPLKTNKSKVINDVDDNAETIQYEYQNIREEQDNEDDDEDIIDK